MKTQRGVTLTSLATYIVLIFFVLAILATVTSNFQSGIREINQEGTEILEINKFNAYFLQEVKKQGNDIVAINENSENNITFSTKNKYAFDSANGIINLIELNEDGTINKTIKIAKNIENCTFDKKMENGKTIIIVEIKVENAEEVTSEYVLNSNEVVFKYEDEEEYTFNNLKVVENNL